MFANDAPHYDWTAPTKRRDAACEVRIIRDDQTADARNILDLLMLKAEAGTSLIVESEGDGAELILAKVVKLFDDGFEVDSDS